MKIPWSPEQASRFKKDLGPKGKKRWAEIANSVLKRGGSEASAIRQASGATRGSIQRRLNKNRGVS